MSFDKLNEYGYQDVEFIVSNSEIDYPGDGFDKNTFISTDKKNMRQSMEEIHVGLDNKYKLLQNNY